MAEKGESGGGGREPLKKEAKGGEPGEREAEADEKGRRGGPGARSQLQARRKGTDEAEGGARTWGDEGNYKTGRKTETTKRTWKKTTGAAQNGAQ